MSRIGKEQDEPVGKTPTHPLHFISRQSSAPCGSNMTYHHMHLTVSYASWDASRRFSRLLVNNFLVQAGISDHPEGAPV